MTSVVLSDLWGGGEFPRWGALNTRNYLTFTGKVTVTLEREREDGSKYFGILSAEPNKEGGRFHALFIRWEDGGLPSILRIRLTFSGPNITSSSELL